MATCGQQLDPWQRLGVRITLATCEGSLAASEVGILAARQNGKGGIFETVAVFSLFEVLLNPSGKLKGSKNTTIWTAHELKTTDEAWTRVCALIKQNDELAKYVVLWNGGLTGTHIIELDDGSRLVFVARSKSSIRGFSPRRIIFDEAQEFSALAHRAAMYATSAQGKRRQLIYTGTVPGPENDAAIWTGVRDRGRAGTSPKLAWAEWTPDGSDDPATKIDPTSWEVRAAANPALNIAEDHGILAETIDEEWEAAQADIDGFLRERLSVWPSGSLASLIFPMWRERIVEAPSKIPIALGIAGDVDQQWLSLGAIIDGDQPHAAAILRLRSTQVDKFIAEANRIADEHGVLQVIQKGSPVEWLEPKLRNVLVVGLDTFAAACAAFENAIKTGTLTHGDYELLNAAANAAEWKERSDRRILSRRSGHIDMLEAVVLAFSQYDSEASYDVLASIL